VRREGRGGSGEGRGRATRSEQDNGRASLLFPLGDAKPGLGGEGLRIERVGGGRGDVLRQQSPILRVSFRSYDCKSSEEADGE